MLGKIIRKLRDEKKVTQLHIAEVIGVAQSTYALYEKNRREPSLGILISIADYFNVTLDYLAGRPPRAVQETIAEYGQKNKELLDLYYQLNSEGKNKLIEYAQDLINGGRYKKDISNQKMKNA